MKEHIQTFLGKMQQLSQGHETNASAIQAQVRGINIAQPLLPTPNEQINE